ncbi:MAG: hypothetical protein ACI94Y_001298 [Maribacter sp.]|jgi:uncharacterized protein (DUF2147 family)
MKLQHLMLTLLFTAIATLSFAQVDYIGQWKTIDDATGNAKAYVDIYEQGGKLYGKIVKVLDESKTDSVCEKCKGDKKDQKIEGLIILEGLEKTGDYYDDGTITDPENGKEYNCYIQIVGDGKLKVKGYIGRFTAIGRSQYWYRVK